MMAYLPLIQKILLDYLAKRSMVGRFHFNFQGLGLTALSLVMMTIGFLFLLFAFQTWMRDLYGEPLSWLITAAATLAVSAIIHFMAHKSRKKNGLISHEKEEPHHTQSPLGTLLEEVVEPIKDHPLASVLIAGLTGIMAAEKFSHLKGTESEKHHGTD